MGVVMRKNRIHAALAAVATSVFLLGCSAPEDVQNEPPAQELQSFEAEEGTQYALGAPAPEIGQSIRQAAIEVEEGAATFYADKFEGRRTASGRAFKQSEMVAAHKSFPFGTKLRVTNTRNENTIEVEVVDRGPFTSPGKATPVIDLSRTAAEKLNFIGEGRAQVKVEVLEWGP